MGSVPALGLGEGVRIPSHASKVCGVAGEAPALLLAMLTTELRLAFKKVSQSLGKVLEASYLYIQGKLGGRHSMASLPLWLKWPSERSKLYHDKVLKVQQPNARLLLSLLSRLDSV